MVHFPAVRPRHGINCGSGGDIGGISTGTIVLLPLAFDQIPRFLFLFRHLPNALTCGHLFCGCAGIVAVFDGNLVRAAYLIGLAAGLDFLDGFVARWLGAASAIGKELDSLADCVTFGLLPAMIVFSLFRQSFPAAVLAGHPTPPLCYLAFLIAVFSALRLAKFNVDTRQTHSFIGVPTPANALLIASLPVITEAVFFASVVILDQRFLVGFTLATSFLLVAKVELFAFKFKHYGWAGNQARYVFLILSVVLLAWLRLVGIPLVVGAPLIFMLYLLLSLTSKKSARRQVDRP